MSTKPKNFAKALISQIQQSLVLAGLKKRSQNEFTTELNSDEIGLVNVSLFNSAEGIISVHPSAGVRHQPLEKLVAELSGQDFHAYRPATIGASIGYLTPERRYITFDFAPSDDYTVGVQKIVDAIEYDGYRWMQAHQTLDAILEEILASYRFITRDAARLRLPIIYYLKKDFSAASHLVKKGLAEIGDTKGPVSDQYRCLANSLLHKLPGTQ
jgi:hypothetical protein